MMRKTAPTILLLAVFLNLTAAPTEEFQKDLKERRERAMGLLGPESILILWSAPVRTYSRDVDYKYRQDNFLLYFSGLDQEETILVLMPGNTAHKEVLFIRKRDPQREHWQGRMLSPEEAAQQSGISEVRYTSEFEPFIEAALRGGQGLNTTDSPDSALSSKKTRLALLLDRRPAPGAPTAAAEFSSRIKDRIPEIEIDDATGVLSQLRVVKTPYEQRLLRTGLEISSVAHRAAMRAAGPGVWEYQVEAALEYVYRHRGAFGWGYPSIVGSGPNATILHYTKSTRRMEQGDLLLVDAAANYAYLTGDITRTYPVDGVFSTEQKDIYRIVLEAQLEARKIARTGVRLAEIHEKTVEVIKQGLFGLGLISDIAGDEYRRWYTHGACHYIGMDVHDVGDRQKPLEPGMAFVIEPGIYIREQVLANLANKTENETVSERVRAAVRKYRDIGVRIEDSFLLTEGGLVCLSDSVPRTIEEIEAFMKEGKTSGIQ